MFKKINHIILVVLFLAVVSLPLLFARWESGGVSEEENRNLAPFPALVTEGQFNSNFTKDFETWFMDHMGFRPELIDANKTLMQKVFHRDLTTSDWKTGKTGDSIYAPQAIVEDFAHVNLRTEDAVAEIGKAYQTVSDYLAQKDIPFFCVQCVDKHTIYPERFIPSVKQIGDTSKTDQIMEYLQEETSVNTIYFKQVLLESKAQYDVFSHWGDPTHWTYRGAYISYVHMMEKICESTALPLQILQESDYTISYETNSGSDGETEQVEVFTLKAPKASKVDISVMGQWASDQRHSAWENPDAGNDLRLLVVGDSYFNDYLIDDLAESFAQTWMVWGDHTQSIPELVEAYQPDVVIFECAERVDRSWAICDLANNLQDEA